MEFIAAIPHLARFTRGKPRRNFLAACSCLAAGGFSAVGCAPHRNMAGAQGLLASSSKAPAAGRAAAAPVADGKHHQTSTRAPQPAGPGTQPHVSPAAGPQIPVVALSQTPPEVRATIASVANGRQLEKINRIPQLEGAVFRTYIRDEPGPQLLTVNERGQVIDNAVVVRFEDLPQAVREAAKTAAAGKLQVCRKSIHRPQLTYVLDYLLGEDEPAFALIEASGFVRGLYGYAAEDPD